MPQLDDKYFSVREAARILGIAQSTAVSLIANGEIQIRRIEGIRFPMVKRSDLLAFAEGRWKRYTQPDFKGRKIRMFPLQIIRLNLDP